MAGVSLETPFSPSLGQLFNFDQQGFAPSPTESLSSSAVPNEGEARSTAMLQQPISPLFSEFPQLEGTCVDGILPPQGLEGVFEDLENCSFMPEVPTMPMDSDALDAMLEELAAHDSGHQSESDSVPGSSSREEANSCSPVPMDTGSPADEDSDSSSSYGHPEKGLHSSKRDQVISFPCADKRRTAGKCVSFVQALTEEEKRLLRAEGATIPDGDMMLTKAEERELKKLRRKIKNKLSAQDSRKRKKEYVRGLEQRVEHCTKINVDLKQKVHRVEKENQTLRAQLSVLLTKLGAKGRTGATSGTVLMMMALSFAFLLNPQTTKIPAGYSGAGAETQTGHGAYDFSTFNSRTLLSDSTTKPHDSYGKDSTFYEDMKQFYKTWFSSSQPMVSSEAADTDTRVPVAPFVFESTLSHTFGKHLAPVEEANHADIELDTSATILKVSANETGNVPEQQSNTVTQPLITEGKA